MRDGRWTDDQRRSAQGALLQLAASRARLGVALGGAGAAQAADSSSAARPGQVEDPLASLLSQGVFDALIQRWRQSPWALSLQMADQTAGALLHPMAQRHPIGLVLAAGAVGSLLVLGQPWRWLPRGSLRAVVWPLLGRAVAPALWRSARGVRPGA